MASRNRSSHSYRKRVFVMKNLKILYPAWNKMEKPLDRMYPLSVPWNSIHSSMCLQKSALLLDIFDQLCDGQRTPLLGRRKTKEETS